MLGVHPFPLIRGGGLFLLLVGLAIMVGAVAPRRLWASFIAGVIIASAVVALTAIRLAAPLGKPTSFQLDSLMVAVFIEVIAIGWLGSRLRAATERQRILVDSGRSRRAFLCDGSGLWSPHRASGPIVRGECGRGPARDGDSLGDVLGNRRRVESRNRGRDVLVRSPGDLVNAFGRTLEARMAKCPHCQQAVTLAKTQREVGTAPD